MQPERGIEKGVCRRRMKSGKGGKEEEEKVRMMKKGGSMESGRRGRNIGDVRRRRGSRRGGKMKKMAERFDVWFTFLRNQNCKPFKAEQDVV